MRTIALLSLLSLVLVAGCSGVGNPTALVTPTAAAPAWVQTLIQQFQAETVGNPPQSIWSYQYNGATVYYVPPQCCDQYSQLYDATGTLLCAPDGGLTERGDGKCPDFQQAATNKMLIWQDNRNK